MERPVDFVSTCSAATVDGLGLCGNHDTEVSAALGAGAGEVHGHIFKLTLHIGPYNGIGLTPTLITGCAARLSTIPHRMLLHGSRKP